MKNSEEICPKCKGKGSYIVGNYAYKVTCNLCYGSKLVEWITYLIYKGSKR